MKERGALKPGEMMNSAMTRNPSLIWEGSLLFLMVSGAVLGAMVIDHQLFQVSGVMMDASRVLVDADLHDKQRGPPLEVSPSGLQPYEIPPAAASSSSIFFAFFYCGNASNRKLARLLSAQIFIFLASYIGGGLLYSIFESFLEGWSLPAELWIYLIGMSAAPSAIALLLLHLADKRPAMAGGI